MIIFRKALLQMGDFLPISMNQERLNCILKYHKGMKLKKKAKIAYS